MVIQAIDGGGLPTTPPQQTLEQQASSAFDLSFESLLNIVLTQLTFQDPLKPIENSEFVSQLAQYTQIQQTDTMSARLEAILQAEAANQAAGLLGRVVDVPAGPTIISGKVISVAFQNGEPRLTLETGDNQTISNISLSSISQIREEE